MKKVEEWLMEMPEPYKGKSLKYHSLYRKTGGADCLPNALVLAFRWSSTKEGSKYWKEVHEMCTNGFPKIKEEKQKIKPKKIKVKKVIKKQAKIKISTKKLIEPGDIIEKDYGIYYENLNDALRDVFKT